jgi:hypothetical protein
MHALWTSAPAALWNVPGRSRKQVRRQDLSRRRLARHRTVRLSRLLGRSGRSNGRRRDGRADSASPPRLVGRRSLDEPAERVRQAHLLDGSDSSHPAYDEVRTTLWRWLTQRDFASSEDGRRARGVPSNPRQPPAHLRRGLRLRKVWTNGDTDGDSAGTSRGRRSPGSGRRRPSVVASATEKQKRGRRRGPVLSVSREESRSVCLPGPAAKGPLDFSRPPPPHRGGRALGCRWSIDREGSLDLSPFYG